MPKSLSYPRASLDRCLELAAAIHELGGESTLAAAAERLGLHVGGSFHAVVSSAVRYGFVSVRRGRLRTAPAYRAYRLAYDATEREQTLADALANVPLFKTLLERYAGRPMPAAHLDRLLVREHSVAERSAERVARYFLEAARSAGLLHGGVLRGRDAPHPASADIATLGGGPVAPRAATEPMFVPPRVGEPSVANTPDARRRVFTVHVAGPGLESRIEVADASDLELVRALVARLERACLDRP